eukprot:10842354-Alexandrium_andersonii.AAC.1
MAWSWTGSPGSQVGAAGMCEHLATELPRNATPGVAPWLDWCMDAEGGEQPGAICDLGTLHQSSPDSSLR